MITLQDLYDQFSTYIYLEDFSPMDILYGIAAVNQLPGDPVSLYITGPSSSAKSEFIDSLRLYPRTYSASSLTSHTFLSGYKEPGKKGSSVDEYSLLFHMTDTGKNIILLKDFTTIISMNERDQQEILSQIREIADGHYKKPFGNEKQKEVKEWRGKIAFLAAVTNEIDRFSAQNTQLGERFLHCRVTSPDAIKVSKKVQESLGREAILREEMQRLTCKFMEQFDIMTELPPWEPDILEKFHFLTAYTVKIRSQVIWDYQHNIMISPANPEGGGRFSKFLGRAARGIAMVQGKPAVDWKTYALVKKLARDSSPQFRIPIIEWLYRHPNTTMREIMHYAGINKATAYRHLLEMESMGIVFKGDKIDKAYTYFLGQDTIDQIDKSEVYVTDYIGNPKT